MPEGTMSNVTLLSLKTLTASVIFGLCRAYPELLILVGITRVAMVFSIFPLV